MRKALAVLLGLLLAAPAQAMPNRTGGGAPAVSTGLVTTITVQNTTSSAQTNVPVTIGLPLAANALPSGTKIKVVDSDGVTALPVQEDDRASDLGGNVRFSGLTVLLPNLNASETRTLTVYTTVGSPATGTDITAADILATSYDYQATFTDHNGSTYTCSARTGLAAGTYTTTTSPATLGTWRSGGGLATEYIVMVPPTSGGTPHPQLRCVFDVLAIKAGTGAVSGGNPITAIRTDRVIESGWIQNTSAVTDDWYGLSETSGSTTYSYPNSTPTQTLTVTTNAVTNTTVTASSSLFTANSLGNLITDGTGYGVIVGYTSPTQVTVNLYKAFASASLTSGGYTIYGIHHPYGSRYRQRIWWSGLATPQYTANLGPAWNNSTLTGGPLSYIASARAIPNYATSASSVTNSLTRLSADGANPVGYTASAVGSYGGGLAGDIEMYIGQTGERGDIGVTPDWYTQGLIRYDSNALPVIFGDADKANLIPFHLRNPSTGKPIRMDNGTDWYLGGNSWGSHYINTPGLNSSTTSISNWNIEDAHLGQYYYVPYLLTGDWYWLDSMQLLTAFLWLDNNPSYSGSQLNRLKIINDQMRGTAWSLRSIGETALVTPDTTPSSLGWSKAHIETWLANQWTATNSGTAGVAPYPGAIVSLINNTGAGKRYSTDGPRWTATGGSGQVYSQWQLGYLVVSMYHLKDLGMLDANGLSALSWLGEGITSAVNDSTQVRPEYAATAYWSDVVYPTGTNLSSWGQVYGAAANDPAYANNRTLPVAMTLSATSGTAITATIPTGYLNGGSFYVGGWVSAVSGGGRGQITAIAVNSPTGYDTLTLTTSGTATHDGNTTNGATFGSLNYAASAYLVPWPAPGDPIGNEMTAYLASPNNDYLDIARCANMLLNQDGYAGEPAAYNAVSGWSAASWGTWEIKWHLNPR